MLHPLRRPLRRGRRTALAAVALAVVLLPASSQAASLGGKVTSMASDQAVAQFTVELYSATMTPLSSTCTDALGNYAFNNLAPAVYHVSFSGDPATCAATGFAPGWWEGRGLRKYADPVDLTAGGNRADINSKLQAQATISGTVKDAVTKAGIANVSVRVIDTDQQEVRRTCTDGSGNYLALRLTGGVYGVQFVSDGSCGAVAGYASQFYETGATFAQAKAVLLGYGEDATATNVELSMPAPPTPTPTPVPDPTPTPTASPTPAPTPTATPAPTPPPAAGATPTPTPKPSGTGTPTPTPKPGTTPTPTPKPGTTPAPTPSPSGGGSADGPGSGPTPVAAQKPVCTLKSTGKVSGGAFSVTVTCDRQAKLALGGTLKFRRGGKTTTVKLKTVSATSSKSTLKLRVPAKAATARKAKVKVSGSLKLTASTTAGSTTKSLTVARLK